MPILTTSIPAGASISSSMNIGNFQVLMIISPPAWTTAPLSFQMSIDDATWYDLTGVGEFLEQTMPCYPNRAYNLAARQWPKGIYLKIRSGGPAMPINQVQNRNFMVLTG